MTRRAELQWTMETGIEWHRIAPGKPKQNASIESFNSKRRDACLFGSLADAIEKIEAWRNDDNSARPRSSIDNQKPAAFAAASVLAMVRSRSDRAGEKLRHPRGFAPRPVATTTHTVSHKKQTRPSNGSVHGLRPVSREIAKREN
jgi:putative transposase